jgi:hypothetical protein
MPYRTTSPYSARSEIAGDEVLISRRLKSDEFRAYCFSSKREELAYSVIYDAAYSAAVYT